MKLKWIQKTCALYELQHTFSNDTVITVAQVAERRESEDWQSQFTCNTDRKLTRVRDLAANIIQISWYFGMSPDEVKKQFVDYLGIFSNKGE